METHEEKTSTRDMLLRAIAVLGLIAVLLLGAWGIIQLAVSIPAIFSNIGGGVSSLFTPAAPKEALTVSASKTGTSDQPLQVTWEHTNKDGEYSYGISYACQKGLSLKAPLPTGTYQPIACNTPFNFVNAGGRMTLIPTLTDQTAAPLVLTVAATKLSSGAVTAQGTSTVSVSLAAASSTPSKPKTPAPTAKTTAPSKQTTASYYAAPTPPALYGQGDLAATINSIAPAGNGLSAVNFTIVNVGTNVIAGGWTFNADLPINGTYTYVSPPQRPLLPGDKVVYTLTFSNSYGNSYNSGSAYNAVYGYDPRSSGYWSSNYYTKTYSSGSGVVTITADPQNLIWETNEQNNRVSSGYQGSYGNY